jgi:transcriptional repressor NrdR
MKCPYCGHLENKVVDSRLNKENTIIRRRRSCESCEQRFTTYERLEVMMPMLAGLKKACEKRPVSMENIDEFVDSLERELQDMGEREVPTQWIGEKMMEGLAKLDEVAYVRFASVYRQFKDINEFMDELKGLLDTRKE